MSLENNIIYVTFDNFSNDEILFRFNEHLNQANLLWTSDLGDYSSDSYEFFMDVSYPCNWYF